MTARFSLSGGRFPGMIQVLLYEHQAQMLDAANRYNGNDLDPQCRGVTQLMQFDSAPSFAIVRLYRDYATPTVVLHELHHAVTALYGETVPSDAPMSDILTHFNEPFAHAYSDVVESVSSWLARLGVWGETDGL